jgi:7,8-dihydropterin-6-yl-methyl-4-(beta-D-ribofuranosyl)aminobenzene 5'-phosphate synthase
MSQSNIAADDTGHTEQNRLRLQVVFNNVPYQVGLQTGWGFACLIQGLKRSVLFDTGGDGEILLGNMERLGLDIREVDAVVLSHIHGDHTGGLNAFLTHNARVTVYIPKSFPVAFQQEIEYFGASVETITGPRKLFPDVYSTGEIGESIKEQALIIDTQQGLIVITGCAHPDVADMAEQAQNYLGRNIYLLMGGFHLGGSSNAEIRTIIQRLQALGVKKVAPSHCTGDKAIRLFRDAWVDDFIEGGLGAVIAVPDQS